MEDCPSDIITKVIATAAGVGFVTLACLAGAVASYIINYRKTPKEQETVTEESNEQEKEEEAAAEEEKDSEGEEEGEIQEEEEPKKTKISFDL